MFEKFPSLTRFSHGWTVTEKLDGTNACVLIVPFHEWELDQNREAPIEDACTRTPPSMTIDVVDLGDDGGVFAVLAQSRNNLINTSKDNAGFASFVKESAEALVKTLGEGRHYGEWCGAGIQRKYGMSQKVFALFNTARWTGAVLPERVTVVPVLAEGYLGEPGAEFARIMDDLKANGSRFAPGFMDPEGIVMRHGPSGTLFKKTFDYDEQGKWAENEARRAAALS